MKIKIDKILDFLFILFIFSIITLSASMVGKVIQLVSLSLMLFILLLRKPKFSIYNFIELVFVIFVFVQVIFNIAIIKDGTLKTAFTVLYNFLFSLCIYDYVLYRKNIGDITKKYVKTTIVSLLVLLACNMESLLSFRFDASRVFLGLIGGQSSTALSMIAAIPAFFLSIFGNDKNKKKEYIYIFILLIISFLTGTRKTLLIFLFIFMIVYPLKHKKITILRITKIGVSIVLSLFAMSIIIFKVPVIYNIIGYRVENAISIVLNNEDDKIDSSIRVRERMIRQSQELYSQKKTTGWGMDYFRLSNQSGLGYYSHNNFMELLVGGGIVGFIIYYSKYLYLLMVSIKSFIKNNRNSKWFSIIGFMLIMYLLEYWQVTYIYRYVIIYQALILALYTLEKDGDINYDKNNNSI